MDSRIARIAETRAQFFSRKESNHRLSFERRAVRKILKLIGKDKEYVERESEDEFDTTFTFAWFADQYPQFPMSLVAGSEVDTLDLSDLFAKSNIGGKLGKAWAEAYTPSAWSKHGKFTGVVINPGDTTLSGWWVLHNFMGAYGHNPIFIRTTHTVQVCFERLDDLAERLFKLL